MKNFSHYDAIKADAAKLTARRFNEAKEDQGWEPTGPLDLESNKQGDDQVKAGENFSGKPEAQLGDKAAKENDEAKEDKSFSDLRAEAKELGISAGGTKEELAQRVAEAKEGK